MTLKQSVDSSDTTGEGPFPRWPFFAPDEIAAAVTVLESGRVNYWTGTLGRKFEEEFAHWCGARRAVALANGTVALEAALRALRIGPGDEVIVPARTFVATASCVSLQGATPVFADVDRDSGNVTVESIERRVTPRTRAIIPVHLGGWACDMPAIGALARAKRLKVIEDCAQAHGARCGGKSVGTWGDVGAWSFCQDKIMTTGGEGGMITCDDDAVWKAIWSLKDHGKDYDAAHSESTQPGFRWLHHSVGTNWRMTEMQSAIGLAQLAKMHDWHHSRRRNALRLANALRSASQLRMPLPEDVTSHAFYRLYAYVDGSSFRDGWSRDRVVQEVVARGVPCFSGSCSEVYRERAFRNLGYDEVLPVAHELGETSLAFLVHPTLGDSHMDRTAEVVLDVLADSVR
jgi:dTDP-4-amino-4,6-dideoxygalactose transaminase